MKIYFKYAETGCLIMAILLCQLNVCAQSVTTKFVVPTGKYAQKKAGFATSDKHEPKKAGDATSDQQATLETRLLFRNMQKLVDSGVLFGHHDDLAYGVGWRGDKGRSDVKTVTGSYPAIYGWDLSGLELGHEYDINNIPFSQQREYIKQVYARGGINTFCWHLNNPVDGKTAWDTTIHTVAQIIPGAACHLAYQKYLDAIAAYLVTLKGDKGEAIPILFRPFHELTGNWFWWGKNTCTPAEFKNLWHYTIDYLRTKKRLHNLLIVYSTSDFKTREEFLERYPGNDYADILGFDTYCRADREKFKTDLAASLDSLNLIARSHHKLGAIAEIGYEGIPVGNWFTNDLLPSISGKAVSYLMFWRNANTHHFYVPYAGQVSAEDFRIFYKNHQLIFQDRLTPEHVYQQ